MFIYPIYYHNWRNISTIYTIIYNKSSIKRNSLTTKKIHREVGRAKDLSAPLYEALLPRLKWPGIEAALVPSLEHTEPHKR